MKYKFINKPGKHIFKVRKDEEIGVVMVNKGVKMEVVVELVEEGAKALILAVGIGKDKDMVEILTETNHKAGNTHADTIVHGVMKDESKAEIKGMIRIEKKTQRVTDFLTEKVLLLSDRAAAIAEPSLEIETNEVRASHAATVAPIDKEQILYLQTRGLSKKQAEKLIVDGFLKSVIERIKDAKIRKQVEKEIFLLTRQP